MSEYVDLVMQAQNGTDNERRSAFDELVRRFQNMVYSRAYALTGDNTLAEDAMQETFIAAYVRIEQLREPIAFPGWLRRIVVTQCDRITRGKRPIIESLEARYDIASDNPGPEDRYEEQEIRTRILNAINALPEHERAVTEGFYMHGVSQKELAERLQVPVTTIKKRLQYARQRLRALVGELNAAMDNAVIDILKKRQPQHQPAYIYNQKTDDIDTDS